MTRINMSRLALLVFLFVCGSFSGGVDSIAEASNGLDNSTIAALDELMDVLLEVPKELNGLIAWIQPIPPVVVVSPEKVDEIKEIGFEELKRDGCKTYHMMKTPLDKCNWLSHLICYPLAMKVAVAPGIKSPSTFAWNYGDLGARPVAPDWERLLFDRNLYHFMPYTKKPVKLLTIDNIDSWGNTPEVTKVLHSKRVSILFLAIAIEPPGGDFWLEDMDMSFNESDAFTLYFKVYRDTNPCETACSSITVCYKDILPFLSEFVIRLAETFGSYTLNEEQRRWIEQEPVTDIDALAEFFAGYARRISEFVTDGNTPISPEVEEYFDEIYDELERGDPGNTISMSCGYPMYRRGLENPQNRWMDLYIRKPYLIYSYENIERFIKYGRTGSDMDMDIVDLWEDAVEIRPDEPIGLKRLSSWYLLKDECEMVLEYYHRCERIQPMYYIDHWGGGGALDTPSKIEFGYEVLKDYPDSATVICAIVAGYEHQGDLDTAIDIAESAVEKHPKFNRLWSSLMRNYRVTGQREKEVWAIEGYLTNCPPQWATSQALRDFILKKARVAELKDDSRMQVNYMLMLYPPISVNDENILNMAELLLEMDTPTYALFLLEAFLGANNMGFRYSHHQDWYMKTINRAIQLRDRVVKAWWPEFNPSKCIDTDEYDNFYENARGLKQAGRLDDAAREYRELLDDYPSINAARRYVEIINEMYEYGCEESLEARLVQAVISDALRDESKRLVGPQNYMTYDSMKITYLDTFLKGAEDPIHRMHRQAADAAKQDGDIPLQINHLAEIFPFQRPRDSVLPDLAEALFEVGDINNSLYIIELFLADMDKYHLCLGYRWKPEYKALLESGKNIRTKILRAFWPEFDPSKIVRGNQYQEYYKMAKQMWDDGDLRSAAKEYRRLLSIYPSLTEAKGYVNLVTEIDENDLDVILEAKLLCVIVGRNWLDSTKYSDHYISESLQNWGIYVYNDYLKSKLLDTY